MKKTFFKLLIILFLVFVSTQVALAFDFEEDSGLAKTNDNSGYTEGGLETKTLPEIIGLAIETLLAFIGVFFLLLALYAGFKWMLSRGNSQEIETAQKTLQNATIGLIIVLIAYAVTYFIMNSLSTIQTT